ncbi:MAG TPA: glucokinase [Solirubrobacteraceae bacterium]|jgi:glucokinase|nr:glucokinase [Solirubrobacteraceae bacterium]
MIIAADIGGTSCRLAACEDDGRVVDLEVYPSRDYARLGDVVSQFAARGPYRFRVGCFGLPGAVIGGRCKPTDLPWELVDAAELAAATGIDHVELVNDLEANAYGLPTLSADELLVLNAGCPVPGGNVAIVSPGTGLGEAAVILVDGAPVVIASEGGHADFGPIDDGEVELLRYIQRFYRCATYELVLSGYGLECMYQVQRERLGGPAPERLAANEISEAALAGDDEMCVRALDMYVSILAAEAANATLKFFALGGVFIGGGIAPKIRRKLVEPAFMDRFACKDKMAGVLRSVPVSLILNDRAALQGAITHAARLARAA